MKTSISTLLILALSIPEAVSARVNPRASSELRDEKAAPVSLENQCDLKEDPFNGVQPKQPSNRKTFASMNEEFLANAKFENHCKAEGTRAQGCDFTLARTLQLWEEGKTLFSKEYKKICQQAIEARNNCSGNQADAQKCVADLAQNTQQKIKLVSDELTKRADALEAEQKKQGSSAEAEFEKMKIKTKAVRERPPAGPAIVDVKLTKIAESLLKKDALTGEVISRGETQTSTCTKALGSANFCGHVTAAADAIFFSKKLRRASEISGRASVAFREQAKAGRTNSDIGGSIGDGNGPGNNPGVNTEAQKSGGILESMGGLDGIMKMATLGIAGAGLYCTISGQCSQKPAETENSASDPGGLSATSPTPSSTNAAPSSTNIGDDTEKTANSGSPIDTKTETDNPSFGTQDFSSSGSGFSSDSGNETALAPVEGSLARAPATSEPGGDGGGIPGGSGSSGSSETLPLDLVKSNGFDSGGIGAGIGGGGSSGGGGFSLGDTGSTSPADSALKDILNGETPLGDPSLASMIDGDPNSAAQAGGEVDLQGVDSLFLRVRDTHVRCVKRGCVGRLTEERI